MRGLNATYGVEEKRNYFVIRLVASLYTVIMLFVVLVSLFIMVFGEKLIVVVEVEFTFSFFEKVFQMFINLLFFFFHENIIS